MADAREALPLQSAQWEPEVRQLVALAAKLSVQGITEGRFPRTADIDALDGGEAIDVVKRTKEQQIAGNLARQVVDEAEEWLEAVCSALQVSTEALPDDIHPDAFSVKADLSPAQCYEIASDLVLISIGLNIDPDLLVKRKQGLVYSSLRRTLLCRACANLRLPRDALRDAERAISQTLFFQYEASKAAEKEHDEQAAKGVLAGLKARASTSMENARQKGSTLKWAATGAGFILGGVAIGLTGGLAAPAIAPFLVGATGLAFFASSGGAILVGMLFGLTGGGLASYRTHRRLEGIAEFEFHELAPVGADPDVPLIPALTSTIVSSGYLLKEDDWEEPWADFWVTRKGGEGGDGYALKCETKTFLALGQSLDNTIRNYIVKAGGIEILKRTVLSAFWIGAALPLGIAKGAGLLLDSEFSRARDKTRKAGLLLADVLEDEAQGKRPCTLIGAGLGACIVFEALLELHRRQKGSLVYSAVLISAPLSPNAVEWAAARSVVAHKFVNAYSANDYVLSILCRINSFLSTRFSLSVAGLQEVKAVGIENINVGDLLGGHLELTHKGKMSVILERIWQAEEQA